MLRFHSKVDSTVEKENKKEHFTSIKNSAFSPAYLFSFRNITLNFYFKWAKRTQVSAQMPVLDKLSYRLLSKLYYVSSLINYSLLWRGWGELCSPGNEQLIIRPIDWKYRFTKNAKEKETFTQHCCPQRPLSYNFNPSIGIRVNYTGLLHLTKNVQK